MRRGEAEIAVQLGTAGAAERGAAPWPDPEEPAPYWTPCMCGSAKCNLIPVRLGLHSADKELRVLGESCSSMVSTRSHCPQVTEWVSEALGGPAVRGVELGLRLAIIVKA